MSKGILGQLERKFGGRDVWDWNQSCISFYVYVEIVWAPILSGGGVMLEYPPSITPVPVAIKMGCVDQGCHHMNA